MSPRKKIPPKKGLLKKNPEKKVPWKKFVDTNFRKKVTKKRFRGKKSRIKCLLEKNPHEKSRRKKGPLEKNIPRKRAPENRFFGKIIPMKKDPEKGFFQKFRNFEKRIPKNLPRTVEQSFNFHRLGPPGEPHTHLKMLNAHPTIPRTRNCRKRLSGDLFPGFFPADLSSRDFFLRDLSPGFAINIWLEKMTVIFISSR